MQTVACASRDSARLGRNAMALFECSTPERRRLDQALPTIPNEIYLSMIEAIAPSTGIVTRRDQLQTLSKLAGTCRFFANICLPRIFEFIELSRPDSRCFPNPPGALIGSTLFKQIVKKQPLALALAQSVRKCLFRPCRDDRYAKKCIAVMSHMNNIRHLQLSECNVDGEYWSMLAMLPSLSDLEFYKCNVLQDLVHTEPERCLKLKLSRLLVVECGTGHQRIIPSVDVGCLRMLGIDFRAIEEGDWLRPSAITELYLYTFHHDAFENYVPKLHVALTKAPRSLQALGLKIDETTACTMAVDIVESMLQDPAWKDLSSLRSFTALLRRMFLGKEFDLIMNNNLPKMRSILHDKLGPVSTLSDLNYIRYFWSSFCLTNGKWSEGYL